MRYTKLRTTESILRKEAIVELENLFEGCKISTYTCRICGVKSRVYNDILNHIYYEIKEINDKNKSN